MKREDIRAGSVYRGAKGKERKVKAILPAHLMTDNKKVEYWVEEKAGPRKYFCSLNGFAAWAREEVSA